MGTYLPVRVEDAPALGHVWRHSDDGLEAAVDHGHIHSRRVESIP